MHGVNDLVISCIDFRFRNKISKRIEETLKGESDLVSIAGASKAILDRKTRKTTLTQIEIAKRLHGITTVHIMDHLDCGAYGGSGKFKTKEAEVSMHEQKLRNAAQVVKEAVPGIQVKLYIVGFDSIIDVPEVDFL